MSHTSKKNRIAVVMPRLSRYGGAEGFAWRLAEALADEGYAVDFICARVETKPPTGVTPVVVGRFGGLRFIKAVWFAWKAEIARRNGNYDLVFGLGKTLHQDILRIGGGPLKVFWRLSQQAWEPGFPRTMKMLRRRLDPVNWVISYIDQRRMHSAGRIVCVSHLVRDWVVEAFPSLDEKDIQIVYNKPDLTHFHPVSTEERFDMRQKAGIDDGDVVITTAGTNFALKGIRQLIEALTMLPENYTLHVAGGRKAGKYERLAKSLDVGHRVRFYGKVDDMPSFYNMGDVFCLASFYDACSNAVTEALACGTRVVSSATNGSAFFLPHDRVFKTPANVRDMAAVIERVSKEPRPDCFAWPDDVACGLEPYVAMIKEELKK